MRKRKVRVLALGMVTGVAALLGAVGVGAPTASAATTTGLPAPYVVRANSSDPDAEPCTYNAQQGYCLYTSQDLAIPAPAGNPYPMNQTLGYFSADGLNWQYIGVVFSEGQYVSRGWVQNNNVRHLWAPQQAYGNGYSFLYVPDVSDAGNPDTTSFIGVSVNTADKPFGPFTPVARITGDPNVNQGYASDPNILTYNTDHYLTYANGDGNNCGGISTMMLQHGSMVRAGTSYQLPISGITALGDCGAGHPYEEGPSLYYTPDWGFGPFGMPGPFLLVFAVKPTSTPPQCANYGEPNTANSVIAYATADTLDIGDPTWTGFTYRGILMCGSTNEWTDQASIIPMRANTGDVAPVLIYHDATNTGTGHNRTLHAECLMYGGGRFAGAMRTGGSDFTNGGAYQCLQNFDANAAVLMPTSGPATVNGNLVTAVTGSGGQLQAARQFAGPSEISHFAQSGSPIPVKYSLYYSMPYPASSWNSQANNEYVTAPAAYSKLAANATSLTSQGLFDLHFYSDGTVTIFGETANRYVQTATDTTLQAVTIPSGNPERYTVMHY